MSAYTHVMSGEEVATSRSFDRLCRHLTPIFIVIFVVYWLALYLRHAWTRPSLLILLVGCLAGETVAQILFLSSSGEEGTASPAGRPSSSSFGERISYPTDKEEGMEHLEGGGVRVVGGVVCGVDQISLTVVVLVFASAASLVSSLDTFRSALVLTLIGLLRFIVCVYLDSLTPSLRPFAGYLSAALAVIGARYTEAYLVQEAVEQYQFCNHAAVDGSRRGHTVTWSDQGVGEGGEGACDTSTAARATLYKRRRSSLQQGSGGSNSWSTGSVGEGGGYQGKGDGLNLGWKGRRISLPAVIHKTQYKRNSIELSVVTEAHGLLADLLAVTDMSTLPPNIATGLRAVSNLLKPACVMSAVKMRNSGSSLHCRSKGSSAGGGLSPSPSLVGTAVDEDNELDEDDGTESPYTGETSTPIQRLRRSLPLVRRLSISTWTTTTSATGLPIVDPEPCRVRTAIFHSQQLLQQHQQYVSRDTTPICSPSDERDDGLLGGGGGGGGGFLTLRRRSSEEKSGVITPTTTTTTTDFTAHDIRDVTTASCRWGDGNRRSAGGDDAKGASRLNWEEKEAGGDGSLVAVGAGGRGRTLGVGGGEGGGGTSGAAAERKAQIHVALQKRLNMTSDYDSSDSPTGSEPGDALGGSIAAGGGFYERWSDQAPPPVPGVLTADQTGIETSPRPCGFRGVGAGGYFFPSTSPSQSVSTSPAHSRAAADTQYTASEGRSQRDRGQDVPRGGDSGVTAGVGSGTTPQLQEGEERRGTSSAWEWQQLERSCGELLEIETLNRWDYQIFELAERVPQHCLALVAHKIFAEVGLLETFHIPIDSFLSFFHAVEMGYREKPYHNRIHATDVLHGVYYMTSQRIPGFSQIDPNEVLSKLDAGSARLGSDSSSTTVTVACSRLDRCGGPSYAPSSSSPSSSPSQCSSTSCSQPQSPVSSSYGIMGCNMSALELMALYAAAAMHDYDHPGRTNAFLVAVQHPLAVLYNDRSVLENHHSSAAWRLIHSSEDVTTSRRHGDDVTKTSRNWLVNLDAAEFRRFRFLVVEAILGTDLKRHFDIVAEFNAKVNGGESRGGGSGIRGGSRMDWTSETDRLLISTVVIKMADINAPCKPKDLHLEWTRRITEEFYEQGDDEASRGMSISPYMDRRCPRLAALQDSFINHLVAPLCMALFSAELLPGDWLETEQDTASGSDLLQPTKTNEPNGDKLEEEDDEEDDDENDDDDDGSDDEDDDDEDSVDTAGSPAATVTGSRSTSRSRARRRPTSDSVDCPLTRNLALNRAMWSSRLEIEQQEQAAVERSPSPAVVLEPPTTVTVPTVDEQKPLK